MTERIQEKNITTASIARRDFPLAPEEIKEMQKIGDGGGEYLFFARDIKGRTIVVHGRKITIH